MKERVIVMVEDNRNDEDLALRAFRSSKLTNRIVVLRDGQEALDYLLCKGPHANRAAAEEPLVVLLDLNLPKVSGLEVLRRLRAAPATKLLPVVILTSSVEDQDRLAGYGLGANSYVRKPVEFNAFTDAVKQLGLYWLLLNEAPPS